MRLSSTQRWQVALIGLAFSFFLSLLLEKHELLILSRKNTPIRFIISKLRGAIRPDLSENCYQFIVRFVHVFWLGNVRSKQGRSRNPKHLKSGKAGRCKSTCGETPCIDSRASSPPAGPTK